MAICLDNLWWAGHFQAQDIRRKVQKMPPSDLGPEPVTFQGAQPPQADQRLEGAYVTLVPLSVAQHAGALAQAFAGHDGLWEFMAQGPFATPEEFSTWLAGREGKSDPLFYVLQDPQTGRLGGLLSLMRITPEHGVIEIGGIVIAPHLQRRRAATEAIFLLMEWAFHAGYRRCEWKCDARNLPSRRAAQRYGFSFEGIFHQHMVIKGLNRDTAWFSVIDRNWPALREAFRLWLAPENFDAEERQIERLSDLTRLADVRRDPAL